MKTTIISELPVLPEKYKLEVYEEIDWSGVDSEMTDGQRRFISGLVQYYQPEQVLELGISAGGGTIVLLNALKDSGGTLYSIDSSENFYRDTRLPVGYCALERYSDLLDKSWHIFSGRDPACVMEEIDKKFDFCVIDTCHYHPVEVLNFISILPWLKDGAVVVMHDTSAFELCSKESFLRMLAPRLLLSTVCAEKYIPALPTGNMTASNIAAWQISSDTRKYCQNLFDILYLPWEMDVPEDTCRSVGGIVNKCYRPELFCNYQEALRINKSLLLKKEMEEFDVEGKFRQLKEDTVFYGAGVQMGRLLSLLDANGLEFRFRIWDKNAHRIQKAGNHVVTLPDCDTPARMGQIMIVMIEDKEIFQEIRTRFETLGYMVFHGLKQYMHSGMCSALGIGGK